VSQEGLILVVVLVVVLDVIRIVGGLDILVVVDSAR